MACYFFTDLGGFFGTSFSIRISLPQFGHVRRDCVIVPMMVPKTKSVRQCGQAAYFSVYGSLISRRAIGVFDSNFVKRAIGLAARPL